jgi:hypothetical protein
MLPAMWLFLFRRVLTFWQEDYKLFWSLQSSIMAAVKQTLKSSRVHCKQLLLPVISNQNQSRQITDKNNEEDSNENHSSLTSVIGQG